MPLQSGMIAIGTSGHTVDGREIKASWLTEAAKSYDPKLYTAVLDLNHWDPRWAGTYGKVLSVDTVKNGDGEIVLRANIEPNEALIAMSKKEVLFTSMQLQPNFRETGSHYLTALAVTPKPASVGTEQLKFSSQTSDDNDAIRSDFVKVELSFSDSQEKKPGFLNQLFNKRQEEDLVSKEVAEKIDLLTAAVSELVKQKQEQPTEFSVKDAQALLSEKGFSVTKEPTDDELKAAQKVLEAQGFSVTKEPTEDELKKAKELLSAQGFSVSEKEGAKPEGKDDTDTKGKQIKITREEYEVLQRKFADSKVTEFDFTASVDQTGGGDDLDFV